MLSDNWLRETDLGLANIVVKNAREVVSHHAPIQLRRLLFDQAQAVSVDLVNYAVYFPCSSKAKMSALSKVQMSVSGPCGDCGGCHFNERGVDEQARAEPS